MESTASWELLLDALGRQHPDARLCLVGKLRADERTRSSFGGGELARLQAAFPQAVDCFGMAALAVGTPWLALSGV
ncbi:MAG TPA: hypothetical protein VFD04_17455 [Actinomycetes bacterium]|nr:hypothetical protein [Actinomycetes bacterium]